MYKGCICSPSQAELLEAISSLDLVQVHSQVADEDLFGCLVPAFQAVQVDKMVMSPILGRATSLILL